MHVGIKYNAALYRLHASNMEPLFVLDSQYRFYIRTLLCVAGGGLSRAALPTLPLLLLRPSADTLLDRVTTAPGFFACALNPTAGVFPADDPRTCRVRKARSARASDAAVCDFAPSSRSAMARARANDTRASVNAPSRSWARAALW